MSKPKRQGLQLHINAKCSDLCYTELWEDGKRKGKSDGYVPDFMPEGGGDYVTLDIDVATGKILNWKVPTAKALQEVYDTSIASKEEDEYYQEAVDAGRTTPKDFVLEVDRPVAEKMEVVLCDACSFAAGLIGGKNLKLDMCESCGTGSLRKMVRTFLVQ